LGAARPRADESVIVGDAHHCGYTALAWIIHEEKMGITFENTSFDRGLHGLTRIKQRFARASRYGTLMRLPEVSHFLISS
jgi:hypothetical protein